MVKYYLISTYFYRRSLIGWPYLACLIQHRLNIALMDKDKHPTAVGLHKATQALQLQEYYVRKRRLISNSGSGKLKVQLTKLLAIN